MGNAPLKRAALGAAALAAAFMLFGCSGKGSRGLIETGSSLIYPLMNLWVPAYQRHHPGIQITTQSTGSGTGISQAISGVAQIGASDAYMSDAQIARYPVLNIPLALSAQQINYNLPGLNAVHLRLSGPVLAGIYSGRITSWDDPAILAINRQFAAHLPHHVIIPIHRSDGSGDTFVFTQYLSFSTPSWKRGPGFDTTVSWPPVADGVGAAGNPGMIQSCAVTPFSIAYIGISFLKQTNAEHLGYAALQNRSGQFVLPSAASIGAAARVLIRQTPKDERISLVFARGANAYPLVNYEYAIVSPAQPDPAVRKALVNFLAWAVREGQAPQYVSAASLYPLPAAVQKLSQAQISGLR